MSVVSIELTDEQFKQLQPMVEEFKQIQGPQPRAIVAQVWLYSPVSDIKNPIGAELKCWLVFGETCTAMAEMLKKQEG